MHDTHDLCHVHAAEQAAAAQIEEAQVACHTLQRSQHIGACRAAQHGIAPGPASRLTAAQYISSANLSPHSREMHRCRNASCAAS